MKVLLIIIILSIGQFLMGCNQKNETGEEEPYKVKHVVLTSEEEDPGPPPPGFTSRFKTLKDWLVHICDNEKPEKTIATYNFGLFETKDNYTLFLTGTNTYEVSQDHTAIRIDFAPKDMYFTLPKSEYKNLNRNGVLELLNSQLNEFVTSDKFKHSFLSAAKSIITDWKGEIWAKQISYLQKASFNSGLPQHLGYQTTV